MTGKSSRDGVVMWDADCIFPSRHLEIKEKLCTKIDVTKIPNF